MNGKLYVVATPIGNLSDISLRAIKVLQEVDLIACEDTRHTLQLLNHLKIKKPLISYHQHSGRIKLEKIIEELKEGKDIALVSDAGTPGISDPGEYLIAEALKDGISIEAIPGATAAITALVLSGLGTTKFVFYGFLPHKKGRQTELKLIAQEEKTVIIYESPYRIKKLLGELLEFCGDRRVSISRELTKKFEETYRGKISEVLPKIKEKGEFVVIMEGKYEK